VDEELAHEADEHRRAQEHEDAPGRGPGVPLLDLDRGVRGLLGSEEAVVGLELEDEARQVGEDQDPRDVEADRLDVLRVRVLGDARVDGGDDEGDHREHHHPAAGLPGQAAEPELLVLPAPEQHGEPRVKRTFTTYGGSPGRPVNGGRRHESAVRQPLEARVGAVGPFAVLHQPHAVLGVGPD
jgi:hypothetical protein